MLSCSPHYLLQEILPLAHKKPNLDPCLCRWGPPHIKHCFAGQFLGTTEPPPTPNQGLCQYGALSQKVFVPHVLGHEGYCTSWKRELAPIDWGLGRGGRGMEAFSPCLNCSQAHVTSQFVWFIFYFLMKDSDIHLNCQLLCLCWALITDHVPHIDHTT